MSKMIGLPSLTTANLFSPQRTMTIEIQPPQNLHPRYESDGKRYIENSRKKPMVIKVYRFSSRRFINILSLVLSYLICVQFVRIFRKLFWFVSLSSLTATIHSIPFIFILIYSNIIRLIQLYLTMEPLALFYVVVTLN